MPEKIKKTSMKRNWKKNLIITAVALLFICMVLIGTLLVLKEIGQSSLRNVNKAVITGRNIDGKDITEAIQYKDSQFVYNQDLINILVLGVDNAESISREVVPGNLGQTDAMYLVSLDMNTKDIHVMGIPRDTVAPISIVTKDNVVGGIVPMQITLQYAYGNNVKSGANMSAQAVSTLMENIPIQDVCVINWDTVAVLNDAIGGVTVTIQDDFTDESGEEVAPEFYQGNTVTLKGEQAWLFVKERDCNVFGSALERVSNQEQYIDAFINQTKHQFKKDIFLPAEMYIKMLTSDCYYSTLKASECVYLVSQLQEFHISKENIDTLPGNVEKGVIYMGENRDIEVETGYEEFHVNQDELRELLISRFYVKK